MSLRRVASTRFLNSMMEGGSRPALIKADDGQLYVVKLRGAAQGVAPLAAEIVVGELARALHLLVPEIVLVDIPPDFSIGEPDPELRELLQWSAGTNVGLEFVPEAVMFDPASAETFATALASCIIWLDALTLNVDRTATNPNLLQRSDKVILIDHGAALYFHFSWSTLEGKSTLPFASIQRHVLLPWAMDVQQAAAQAKSRLTEEALGAIVDLVPDDLFAVTEGSPSVAEQRRMYKRFLAERLAASFIFEQEIQHAHEAL